MLWGDHQSRFCTLRVGWSRRQVPDSRPLNPPGGSTPYTVSSRSHGTGHDASCRHMHMGHPFRPCHTSPRGNPHLHSHDATRTSDMVLSAQRTRLPCRLHGVRKEAGPLHRGDALVIDVTCGSGRVPKLRLSRPDTPIRSYGWPMEGGWFFETEGSCQNECRWPSRDEECQVSHDSSLS